MLHLSFKPLTVVQLFFVLAGLVILMAGAVPLYAAEPEKQAEAEWLVMLYMDADDETLEQSILLDLNEAEWIGSSDQVHLVAQVDRFIGGYDGMDDWTSTKRFYLMPDADFDAINSEEIEDLGEVNMADAATLVDFMTWAIENYPARKYALIMSDHGMGWPGGFSDPDPGGIGDSGLLLAEGFGDGIWLMELDDALAQVRDLAGIEELELIGFDVCLMGTLEVFTAMVPYAHYAVASQEEEPGVGWAYAAIMDQLVTNPQMDGSELSQLIVDAYIDQDLVVQQFPEAGGGDITLAAVDLYQIPQVNRALNDFIRVLAETDQNLVAEARAYAQPFNSPLVQIIDENLPSSYIDLANFAQLVAELEPAAADAAQALLSTIDSAVLNKKVGPTRPGSTGMTIEFPVAEQYGAAENLGYLLIARRFTDETQWNEFLTFHNESGQAGDFNRAQDETPAPESEEIPGITSEEDLNFLLTDIQFLIEGGYSAEEALEIMEFDYGWPAETVEFLAQQGVFEAGSSRSYGSRSKQVVAKPVRVEPLILSAEIAQPDAPVLIQADISGERIGYIYSFIGRFQPRADVLVIEDMDYIFADENKITGGVTRPVWPEEGLSLEYEWPPTVYAISDGTTSVRALLEPETYGDSPVYQVKGVYTFADTGNKRPARISFQDGEMTQVFVFSGQGNAGAPRQVTPNPGDTFTVLERGFDFSQGDEQENYSQEGETLTFGSEKFFIEETPAPSGNYVVGILVEDLAGQRYEQYEGLFVVNPEAAAVDGFVPYVAEELGFALLHPETWTAEADPSTESVDIIDEESGTILSIGRYSYPEAATPEEANNLAIEDFIKEIEANGELQNLQRLTEEAEDFVLGAFDGQIVEFSFELDGVPVTASAVVATPVPGTTFGVVILVPDENFDQTVDEVDSILASFDVLLSGVSKEQFGPPPAEMAQTLFSDDFSDPNSGLVQDETEQEWGRGYYTPEGQYTFEMKPNPGAIYDFYLDQALPADFLLEVTAQYEGAANNGYGLIFQLLPAADETGADRFYTFRISGDGYYSVEKVGAETVPLIDWTYTGAINQEPGAANLLAVEGQGNSFNLYINGQQVDSFTDAEGSYSEGTFGLITDNYDEAAPVTFTFDDLTVGTPAQ